MTPIFGGRKSLRSIIDDTQGPVSPSNPSANPQPRAFQAVGHVHALSSLLGVRLYMRAGVIQACWWLIETLTPDGGTVSGANAAASLTWRKRLLSLRVILKSGDQIIKIGSRTPSTNLYFTARGAVAAFPSTISRSSASFSSGVGHGALQSPTL